MQEDPVCMICQQKISSGPINIQCPRCGTYQMANHLASSVICKFINDADRPFISGAIRNLTEKGDIFKFDIDTWLDKLKNSVINPTNPFEKIDLLLEHIERKTKKIHIYFNLKPEVDYPLLFCADLDELIFFLQKAMKMGFVECNEGERMKTIGKIIPIRLTFDGWKRLSDIKYSRRDSKRAFVAMWFDKSMDEVYELGIKLALDETGFMPIKINNKEFIGKIDDEIIAEINKAGILIADFTGQRGGVYYEAGYARGLGIPVIFTCRADEVDQLHFDIRQFKNLLWNDYEELKKKLVACIEANITLGPKSRQ